MISKIENLPENVVGFRATRKVDSKDFTETVIFAVKDHIECRENLNYLLDLDTDISNFTMGAWFSDAILGVQHLMNWNRAAIISNSSGVKNFTDMLSKVMKGEFKIFEESQFDEAVLWLSSETIVTEN